MLSAFMKFSWHSAIVDHFIASFQLPKTELVEFNSRVELKLRKCSQMKTDKGFKE
jgi:hypothetical protein